MFENKKIFILGMARSGYETARILAKHNCDVFITDMNEQDKEHVSELESLNVKFVISDKPTDFLDDSYDFVVKNPGIKLDHPICIKAQQLNIPIVNEIDVAYSFFDGVDIIAITGSNGKTTTTTLIYELLKSHYDNVYIGGNIGIPACYFADKLKKNDILVLEIAGHQLYNCYNFNPNIAIMTNLSEVHIDHFGTYETYKKTKARVFRNQTENDILIYNIGNNDVVNEVKNAKSNLISFTSNKEIKSDLYIKDNYIYYYDEKIINLDDIKIKGNHNYENIMCAIAVCKKYNVSNEEIISVLKKFNGVEHRIEYVKTINNIDFYNDSKSTNVKSTQIALSSFNKDTILLLGGLDRGHSFDELKDYMKNTSLVVCYGETKNRIKEFCDSININCIVCDNLEEATISAYKHAKENSVILLSPACASWDQYKSFEERGNEFKNIINNL